MLHLFLVQSGRYAEAAEATRRNRQCSQIDRVSEIAGAEGVTVRKLLGEVRDGVGWADVVIIAAGDVYFDQSAKLLNHIGYGECFALAPDVWVLRGPPPDLEADFEFGRAEAGERFVRLLQAAGYAVYNPNRTIAVHRLGAGEMDVVSPCALEEIRRGSGETIETPGKIAIVLLGRFGDIVNSLPIAIDLHRKGHQIFWYVRPEFVPLLEGVSYVTPVVWNGPIDQPGPAIEDARSRGYNRVLPIQVEGNPEPLAEKTKNFSSESWRRAGYLEKFHILPCVFDQATPPPADWNPVGDKPILAYCLQAYTSPYAEDLKQDLVQWLKENFGEHFSMVELGRSKWRPDSLYFILRESAVLLSIDTFPLHMAYAAGTPTIALTPRGWIGSEPRRHWIERVSYAQSAVSEGRERIAAALRAVLAGSIQPGKLISEPGWGLPVPDEEARELSILVAALPIHEGYLKALFDKLTPQLTGHQEVEILCDMDPLPTSEKRMRLLGRAAGRYCCFIDVRDGIADNFVSLIMQALRARPDCVGFKIAWVKGGAIESTHDATPLGEPLAVLHHCAIRTELFRKVGFGPGGEEEFAKRIAGAEFVESESFVNAVLYFKPASAKK
jgi:hypothetical protein